MIWHSAIYPLYPNIQMITLAKSGQNEYLLCYSDVDLNSETLYNESIIKKRILEAEKICKSEMVEFGKIIYEKIIEERPNQSEERSRKMLAMLLALDRKHRVRLVNAENDTNNHALLIQKIEEAESILPPVLHNHSVTIQNMDDGENVLEGQKEENIVASHAWCCQNTTAKNTIISKEQERTTH